MKPFIQFECRYPQIKAETTHYVHFITVTGICVSKKKNSKKHQNLRQCPNIYGPNCVQNTVLELLIRKY